MSLLGISHISGQFAAVTAFESAYVIRLFHAPHACKACGSSLAFLRRLPAATDPSEFGITDDREEPQIGYNKRKKSAESSKENLKHIKRKRKQGPCIDKTVETL